MVVIQDMCFDEILHLVHSFYVLTPILLEKTVRNLHQRLANSSYGLIPVDELKRGCTNK